MIAKGRNKIGDYTRILKLTEADLDTIQSMRCDGLTYKVIAKALGLSISCVWQAHNRISWKHIPIQKRKNPDLTAWRRIR